MPLTEFALRVDGSDHSPLVSVLSQFGAYFVVRETVEGENPHFHALLVSDKPIKVVRNKLVRTLFPEGTGPAVRGNGKYSLTLVEDADKYRRYICKGVDEDSLPEVVGKCGMEFTDDWVKQRHSQYWDVHAQLEEAARAKKAPVFETVLRECTARGIRWDHDVMICRLYINELAKRDKAINVFSVRSVVNLIKVKLCPDNSAIDALAQAVADRV